MYTFYIIFILKLLRYFIILLYNHIRTSPIIIIIVIKDEKS